ncbi:MAG: FAD-dependent oxidoreductase [Dehalococcoidia bacterium]
MSSPDVVVVGGGVAGCAVAYELAKAGAKVTIVERDGIGSHASGFSWGGLYPTMGAGIPGPVLEPARRALERHMELHTLLREETGIDSGLRQVESISLAADETGLADVEKDCEWQRSEGFDAEVISARDLYAMEPALAPGLAGGLLQRSHYELDSYLFTLSLARAVEKNDGRVIRDEVTGISVNHGRADGVFTSDGGLVPAGAVVLATGPWSSEGTDALPRLPLKPMKGEILRLRLPGNDFHHRVGMNGRNVGRKPDGLVWVGTYEWERGFDESPRNEGREHILSGALAYAPSLKDAELVQQTACLRPVAADGVPIVGPLDTADNLFAVSGAGKKGVLLSTVMAEMAAALVLGDPDKAPVPQEFSTARFGL